MLLFLSKRDFFIIFDYNLTDATTSKEYEMENSTAKSRGFLSSLIVSIFLLAVTFSVTNVHASQTNPSLINGAQLAWWAGGWNNGWHRGWNGGGYYHRGWGGGGCYRHCWINSWGRQRCNTNC
jgi:uncharacterized membrane protein